MKKKLLFVVAFLMFATQGFAQGNEKLREYYKNIVSAYSGKLDQLFKIPLTGGKNPQIDYKDLYKTLSATTNQADSCYLLCAYEAGDHYYEQKDYETAVVAYNCALRCARQMYKTEYPSGCFRAYKMLGFAYFKLRDEKAGFMQEMAANTIPDEYPDRQKYYYQSLYSTGTTYKIFENYAKADSIFAICENYINANEPKEKIAAFYNHRANACEKLDQGSQAVTYYKKANQYEIDASKTLANQTAIAKLFDQMGDKNNYLNSITIGTSFIETNFARLDKYQIYNFIVACNSENFNTKMYMDHLASFVENNYKGKDVLTLVTKAYVYYAAGNYRQANNCKNEAIKLHDAHYNDRDTEMQKERVMVSSLLSMMNDVQKTLEYQNQSLSRVARLLGKEHQMYKNYSATIASLNVMYKNDFNNAERLADSLLGVSAPGSETYYKALDLKAVIAIFKGQNAKAAEYYREVAKGASSPKEKFQKLLYDANFNCLEIMTRNKNNSNRQETDRLIAEMETSVNEMSSIAEKYLPKTSRDYFDMLYTKGLLMYLKNDKSGLSDVISLLETIVNQTENLEQKNKEKSSLASLYAWNGDFKKALALMKGYDPESQNTDRNKYNAYMTLASMNFGAGYNDKSIAYYERAVNSGIENVRKFFSILTADERSAYWDMFKQAFYDAGKYATVFDKETAFNGTLYDLALYSKGLLMRSQNAINAKIQALGDSTLMDKIQTIRQLRMAAANGKSGSEKQAELQKDAELLEKELLQECASKGYNLESEFCNYQQVREKLSANDVAVEFVLYHDKDTVGHYGALVLRKNYKYPVLVHIAEKKNFEANLTFDSLTTQMVWGKLTPFFDNAENVYFSPIGIIHRFAIEYLPYKNAGFIADKFNIYRVSSTSELIKKSTKSSSNYKRAIIYGGINYDADALTMAEVVEYQNTTRIGSFEGKVVALKGTLAEAENVSNIFEQKGVNVKKYEDFYGTEESFKMLSGQPNDVIHIGTHGFCNVTDQDLMLAVVGDRNLKANGDIAMNNSGLIFAGYNTFVEKPDPNLEDGKLTAQEVSMMDLSSADLVTLSACVTAVGDITGEGVFGVQRGFKLAGVNTIVMSCWNVLDSSTLMLMTDFYTNLTSGMSKREALLEAVRKVKEKYPQPMAWAAFIMVDGM